MENESDLREEVAELKRQLAAQQQTVVVKEKGSSSAGGVFWGLFHFFITLPVMIFVTCGGCVSYVGSP